MSKIIGTEYDFKNLNIQVGEATNDRHVMNKAATTAAISDASATSLNEAKAYTDSKILGLGERVGTLNPSDGLPTTGSGAEGAIDKNDYWTFEADGSILGEEVHKYEKLIAVTSNPSLDNDVANTDWVIEHAPHTVDHRTEFTNVTVPATIQEVPGVATTEITQLFEAGDSWVVGGVTINDTDIDIVTNNTVALQATKIASLLVANNAFNAQYTVVDDLAGKLTITEKAGQATGVALAHDETGIVGGNVAVVQTVESVAYDQGNYVINHELGYKYVQCIVAETSSDSTADIQVHFLDNNNLELLNDTNEAITVSGVVSI